MAGLDCEFITNIKNIFSKIDKNSFEKQLKVTKEFLKEQNEIRILIFNTFGSGHIGTTIRMMLRLIELGYISKDTRFVLCCEKIEDSKTNIKCCLPNWDGTMRDFEVKAGDYSANAVVIEYFPNTQSFVFTYQIDLGFVGGLDLKQPYLKKGEKTSIEPDIRTQIINIRKNLNVKYFIVLQPYQWTGGGYGISYNNNGDNFYDLNNNNIKEDQKEVSFLLKQHSLFLDEPKEPFDWTPFTDEKKWKDFDTGMPERVKIVKELTDKAEVKINLLPVYGLAGHWKTAEQISGVALNICSGIMKAQEDGLEQAKKRTVILFIATQNELLNDLEDFLKETIWSYLYANASDDCQKWAQDNLFEDKDKDEDEDKIQFLKMNKELDDKAIGVLETKINDLNSKQILIMTIGRLPQEVFDYVYAKATLPPVLEGAGSIELVLNLGRPYFKVLNGAANEAYKSYPTLPPNECSSNTGAIATICHKIASRGIIDQNGNPLKWEDPKEKAYPPKYPPLIVSDMIKVFCKPDIIDDPKPLKLDDALKEYFSDLKNYFHNIQNCKLHIALNVLTNIVDKKPSSTGS
ncbi:MAG: hypothetical protein JXJ04_06325 [Spirochaetales bacterium]|nr:hypothetical protein [Spirochaetales bacterium]